MSTMEAQDLEVEVANVEVGATVCVGAEVMANKTWEFGGT